MSLKLPPGPFKAYLFDCDGTIADSMPLHYVAWSKALSEWNCEFSEDLFYAWGGMPVAKIIATLNEKHGLNMPVEDVKRAVVRVAHHTRRVPLEVSGGVNLETVRAYAETGVEFISIGSLTHSLSAVDMNLRTKPA